MKPLAFAFLCTSLIASASGSAFAQGSSRQGLWWGVGFSYGWAHVACDICRSGRGGGMSVTGDIGGTVSPSLLMAGELNGWLTGAGEVDEYMGTVGAVAYWYPRGGGPFYLKGGMSYVAYRNDDGENALTSSGFGPQVGAGYQVFVTSRMAIQPYFNLIVTLPLGNLTFNGDRQAEGISLGLLQLGLSATWH
ncbi:MAG: hypothetical protein JSU87_04770 [Gemmatimonadota bacterium]|nr:MAG: hypothetical protein JSU87_04770 [Gemmatimonadota bacterium]